MAAWMPQRRRKSRKSQDRAFIEFAVTLFLLGLMLELLYVFRGRSGGFEWMLALPGVAALVGLIWLVSREPVRL
ncbi:MAG TPA: hypothetical protein VF992_00245 [Thermoplasmata archaeon]